jgi:hypothetical protein
LFVCLFVCAQMRTVSLPLPIADRRPPPRCMARRGVRQRPSSVVRTADFCFGRQHDSCARLRKFDRDNRRETPEMIFLALQESNYEQARAHTSIADSPRHRMAPTVTVDRHAGDCLAMPTAHLTAVGPLVAEIGLVQTANVRNRIVQVCEFHALKERLLWSQQVRSLGLLMPLSAAQIGCAGLSARELSDSLVRYGRGRNLRCGNDCCVLVLCVFVLTVG